MLQQLFGLDGRVALVTGAGRGIGREVALAFAQAGADVVLTSRTATELEDVVERINALGRSAIACPADMSDLTNLPSLVEVAIKTFGRIDILVNNAGIALRGATDTATLEDFDYMVDVNLKAVLLLCQAAIPHMRKQGGGKIINVTSLTAEVGDVGSGLYGMSKAGLKLLSKSMAVELARDGSNIQVNCVGPGPFATSQWQRVMRDEPHHEPILIAKVPQGRVADPQEIVGAFLFLASNASSYMAGQTIYVDGGTLSA
jgi:2-deoxy-D-gluconate 3-dehydrogenase